MRPCVLRDREISGETGRASLPVPQTGGMSRNNVVLVARSARRGWFVLGPADADEEWNREWIDEQLCRCAGTGMRKAKALMVAFELQRQWNTEYGVREI